MSPTIQERKKSMTTRKALNGKPYAGNPHVRFDEGEVAPAATPRRGSLLYKQLMFAYVRGDSFPVPQRTLEKEEPVAKPSLMAV